MTACARCGLRYARGEYHLWQPELCAVCVREIKHPSMRDTPADWVTPAQQEAADRMLAELRAYEIPAPKPSPQPFDRPSNAVPTPSERRSESADEEAGVRDGYDR